MSSIDVIFTVHAHSATVLRGYFPLHFPRQSSTRSVVMTTAATIGVTTHRVTMRAIVDGGRASLPSVG